MSKLIEKLDAVFSIYIRRKYADGNGFVRCYTCGKGDHWKNMQCGHFISRKHLSIRWNIDNARPQDVACNIFGQGQQFIFGEKLKKEIGENAVNMLLIKQRQLCKMAKFDYEIQIKYYQEEILKLG